MPLVNMKQLLADAKKGGYAVGSFSVANLEMIVGAVKAAEELKAPIILQIAEVRLKHSPLHIIGPAMVAAANKAKVPVAVHFDHGLTIKKICEALSIGFTSVMIDGSRLPLNDNIMLTAEAQKEAERFGASLEAEIGRVGGNEDGTDSTMQYTDLTEAQKLCEATGIDALAIAIGNAHGFYNGKPMLNYRVLHDISAKLKIPLVLHGGTGITDDDFRKCVRNGIQKINIATATFYAVEEAARLLYMDGNPKDYFTLCEQEVEAACNVIKKHICVFGTNEKAALYVNNNTEQCSSLMS